jgi:hypothetical protein
MNSIFLKGKTRVEYQTKTRVFSDSSFGPETVTKRNAVQEFYLRTLVFQASQACSMTALHVRRPRSF